MLTLIRRIQSHLTRRSMVSTSCCQTLSCQQKCADSSVQRVKATGFSIEVCWFRHVASRIQSHLERHALILASNCKKLLCQGKCADFDVQQVQVTTIFRDVCWFRQVASRRQSHLQTRAMIPTNWELKKESSVEMFGGFNKELTKPTMSTEVCFIGIYVYNIFWIFFSKIQIQIHLKKLLGSKVDVPVIASVPAIVTYVLWTSILLQVKYTLTMTGTLAITGTSTLVKSLSEFWQVSRYK